MGQQLAYGEKEEISTATVTHWEMSFSIAGTTLEVLEEFITVPFLMEMESW